MTVLKEILLIFTYLCYWMLGKNERFLDSLHLIIDLKKYFISVNKTTTNCAVQHYPISCSKKLTRSKGEQLRRTRRGNLKARSWLYLLKLKGKKFSLSFFFSCVISINFWLENRCAEQVVSSAFQTTVNDISWRCDIF